MIAKPRKGRYFPMSAARALALTKDWLVWVYDGKRRQGFLSLANAPDKTGAPFPLLALESPSTLTLFSVPETLDARVAARATERAINVCAELSRSWKPARGHTSRSYVIYLVELGTLIVTERIVRYRPKKYRGTQKFSNAFRPQTLGVEEKEVRRVSSQAS